MFAYNVSGLRVRILYAADLPAGQVIAHSFQPAVNEFAFPGVKEIKFPPVDLEEAEAVAECGRRDILRSGGRSMKR